MQIANLFECLAGITIVESNFVMAWEVGIRSPLEFMRTSLLLNFLCEKNTLRSLHSCLRMR